MNTRHADVIIIGAGTTGLAAAWELSHAGLTVIVLDKGMLSGEGAGKSGSNIRLPGRNEKDIPLMLRSMQLWHSMSDDLGMDVKLQQCGNLWVAFTDEEQKLHCRVMERDLALGIEEYALDREQLREFAPALTSELAGAVFSPGSCLSNPFRVCFAYWKASAALGAEFCFGTEVVEILCLNGRVAGVQTSRERLESETVILAAGPWSSGLAGRIGIELPITVCWYQKLITEAVSPLLPCFVLSTSGSFHQAASGHIHMGHAVPSFRSPFSDAVCADALADTAKHMLNVVPALRRLNALRSWVGFLDMTPDDNFIFGSVPEVKGLVLACGFSGHGYALSPVVGQLLRELIVDKHTSISMEAFKLDRFKQPGVCADSSLFSARG